MTGEKSEERARWFDAWLIILAAPVVVAGCLGAPFLGYDDGAHVGHPLIAPDVPWYRVFQGGSTFGFYTPVTLLSYRFDRWFYGLWLHLLFPESGNAPGYRLTSLLIHIGSALVLWRIFLRLKAGRWCSLFAAAAWAAHPAACESVAWISERKNVLAAFFGFVALWFWVREWEARRGWLRGLVTFLFYLLALLSKPVAAGFLAVFVAYEVLYSARWRRLESSLSPLESGDRGGESHPWQAWCWLLVMFLATGVLAGVNFEGHNRYLVSRLGGTLLNTALTDLEILRLYLCNLLLPIWLSFFYQVDAITSFADLRLWTSLVFLGSSVFVSLWLTGERKLTVFLWCWFLGALLPALNVIPVGAQMQDRYAYFSLPALMLLAALSVVGAGRWLRVSFNHKLAPLGVLVGVGGLAYLACIRSRLYDYDTKLYSDALSKQPNALCIHEHLGVALARDTESAFWNPTSQTRPQLQQCREEALGYLNNALSDTSSRICVSRGIVLFSAGILNMRLGNGELARKQFQACIDAPQPETLWRAFLALAELDLREGHVKDALERTEQAEAFVGLDSRILYWRGRAFEKLGEKEKAMAAYRMIPPGDMVARAAGERIKYLESQQ